MPCIIELAKAKRAYEKIRSAMEQVEATGYGIVMPSIDELSLEQPEIVRQGGRYGVRLEASAPSIHMMKAVIHTELSPIVGTEKQSEDLVQSLLQDSRTTPSACGSRTSSARASTSWSTTACRTSCSICRRRPGVVCRRRWNGSSTRAVPDSSVSCSNKKSAARNQRAADFYAISLLRSIW